MAIWYPPFVLQKFHVDFLRSLNKIKSTKTNMVLTHAFWVHFPNLPHVLRMRNSYRYKKITLRGLIFFIPRSRDFIHKLWGIIRVENLSVIKIKKGKRINNDILKYCIKIFFRWSHNHWRQPFFFSFIISLFFS